MMYIDGICLTRTFQSMLYVLLCNLFSFMGSTRRRQLNIYYRRFRCFFYVLVVVVFFASFCFVRYVWLLFASPSMHTSSSSSSTLDLFSQPLSFLMHEPEYDFVHFIFRSTKFVVYSALIEQQNNEKKKTEERTTVFLEIVWRNFAMAMAVAARVNVHTATMSDFLSDIIWTELPNATNNEEQWNTRIHTKPNTEAVGTIAKRMKSNPMNLCHSRFNEKNHNIFQ